MKNQKVNHQDHSFDEGRYHIKKISNDNSGTVHQKC